MNPKYVWSHHDFDKYLKEEIKNSKQRGLCIGSVSATKLITDGFLKPNNVHLTDLIKPKKVKGWKKNGGLY